MDGPEDEMTVVEPDQGNGESLPWLTTLHIPKFLHLLGLWLRCIALQSRLLYGDDDADDDNGQVLSHIISQLRPGADLSRVVLPTFILEPRSMLERITK